MKDVHKLGLIAGGGALPQRVLEGAAAMQIPVAVLRLKGFANTDDFDGETIEFGLGEFGGMLKTLKKEGCSHISFAGTVSRPDFKSIKPDLAGMKYLPGVVKAAARGDDALLSHIVQIFEDKGFGVLAPQALCEGAVIQKGYLGSVKPKSTHADDIRKALDVAKAIGALDVGQGAVVCNGLVLAVEAQEGTDAMLHRVAGLDEKLRGTAKKRAGVLAKRLKPQQETRVDLPTIGTDTVENAAKAGLAGIVMEAGRGFVMNKPAVKVLADKYGLFILGHEPQDG